MDAASLRVSLEATLGFYWLAFAAAGGLFAFMAWTRMAGVSQLNSVGVSVPNGEVRALDGLMVALVLLLLQFATDRMLGDLTALEHTARQLAGGVVPADGPIAGGMLTFAQTCVEGRVPCQVVIGFGPIQAAVRLLVLGAALLALMPLPYIDKPLQAAGVVFGFGAVVLVAVQQDHSLARLAVSLALLQGVGS